jgi:NAD(P)H-dependent flavin oxidoreductase YrpB (nitropropane dioxygenase family)
MRTALCNAIGIDLPIIQAPIGSACSPSLIAGVADAGALGMLAASWLAPAELRSTIRAIQSLSSRAFGVNLVLNRPQHHRLEVALEEGVQVFSFAWGDLRGDAKRVHSAGGFVFGSAGSVEQARRAVEAGADAVVAQGWEAGGHVLGDVALSVLLPAVCDAVGPVPVVAAGGIADGRGLVAALALGGQAIWMGTRFLAATEAQVDPLYQDRIIAASDTGTAHATIFDGGWPDAPHRVLRTPVVQAWDTMGRPARPDRPREGEIIALAPDGQPVRIYDDTIPVAGTTGDLGALAMYAGQSSALVHGVAPASALVAKIMREAEDTMARLRADWGSGGAREIGQGPSRLP